MHVTMQVTPPPKQFKDLIECAGGTFVSKLPTKSEEVVMNDVYLHIMHFLDMSPRITFDVRFQGLYVVANPADEAAVKKLRKVRRQLFINLNQDEIVLHRWECRLWTRSGS